MDRSIRQKIKEDWQRHLKKITDAIVEAAEGQKILRISYRDRNDSMTVRELEPYEIKGQNLFAYCLTKNSMRQFRIESIAAAELQEVEFDPRYEIKIKKESEVE